MVINVKNTQSADEEEDRKSILETSICWQLREKKGCDWVVYSLNTLSSKHIVIESLLHSYIVLVHNSYPSTRSQSFKPTKHKPMISTVTR